MNKLFKILAVAALFAFSGSMFAQNLINNGGFETGDFTGWTQSGDLGYTGVCQSNQGDLDDCSGRNVFDGIYMGSFGPMDSHGYLTQAVATTAGQAYTISFWLQNGPSPNDFSLSFDGVTLLDLPNQDGFSWTQYTFTTIATGSSADLQFGFYQPQDYWELDDVSVQETPEPSSLTLLGSALGLGAGFLRKFRS